MTFCFAYGANMSRRLMRRRCPAARPLGPALLEGWDFVIARHGFGSVEKRPGRRVHGVLWRLSLRDRRALDLFEGVSSGAYRRRQLPVTYGSRRVPALVYVARGRGRLRPGYGAIVVEAARDWRLPSRYIAALARRAAPCRLGLWPASTGECGR